MDEITKLNLRRIADMALAEDTADNNHVCTIPLNKCRSTKGPSGCRVHCVTYYKRLCDSVSFEEALAGLKEKYDITCATREQAKSIIKEPELYREFITETRPIPKEDFEESVITLWVALEDLTARFPALKIPSTLYVGAESLNPEYLGLSSLDTLYCERAVTAFNVRQNVDLNGQMAYCHKDERIRVDIIRHEVGHLISTIPTLKAWAEALQNVYTDDPSMDPVLEDLETRVSRYAVFNYPKNMGDFLKESFAEAFSKRTSLDFNPTDYPEWANTFFTRLLKA